MTFDAPFYFDVGALIAFTIGLFGFLSFMTGMSVARAWQSIGTVVAYSVLLGFGERFMTQAIVFERFYMVVDIFWSAEDGLKLAFDVYVFVSFAICLTFSATAFYAMRATLMVRQYPWIYERSGVFGWRTLRQPR